MSSLRTPRKKNFLLNPILKSRIAKYLQVMVNKSSAVISKRLPNRMVAWGRVRIEGGGDTIRALDFYKNQENLRSMSYIRVSGPCPSCSV